MSILHLNIFINLSTFGQAVFEPVDLLGGFEVSVDDFVEV